AASRRRSAARRTRRLPAVRHRREIDERLVVARFDCVLDLLVEAAAGLLGERAPRRVRMLAVRRPLDVFRKRRLGSVAAGVAFRDHLLHEAEAVVTNQRAAARMTAHLEQAPAESVEVATRERDVL